MYGLEKPPAGSFFLALAAAVAIFRAAETNSAAVAAV
jgi:hypothetical protein